uniref:Heat shock protein 83 n=1 Tax=Timema bartmani TaxID=61472 RepID=A0A7R9EX17_9NEOP|nr:unnamed protein product [Timema bartmani]
MSYTPASVDEWSKVTRSQKARLLMTRGLRVFVRELISNASDALEKLRHMTLTGENLEEGTSSRPLEIHIATDKQHRILTIQDTGVGMTKEELVDNLGTIARSGSKAFLEQLKGQPGSSEASSIIGQFGVGFYSSFMVADRVEVFTKSSFPGALGYKWTSDGTGSYEIQEAEGVSPGTKIVLHLKPESREFSDEDTIRDKNWEHVRYTRRSVPDTNWEHVRYTRRSVPDTNWGRLVRYTRRSVPDINWGHHVRYTRRSVPDTNWGHLVRYTRCSVPDTNWGHHVRYTRHSVPDTNWGRLVRYTRRSVPDTNWGRLVRYTKRSVPDTNWGRLVRYTRHSVPDTNWGHLVRYTRCSVPDTNWGRLERYTRRSVIKKYSNFVGCPIFLNGQRANVIQALWLVDPSQALWLMDPKEVTPQMHDEFYRFVGNTFDKPRFTLHYRTDAPLTLRALLYFPEGKPGLFEMNRESDTGVALYSRKVLIKSKTDNILPKWLRFVKGVVDSEDIPLNLSRELLQNSALIRKLQRVLTNRLLRFLHDKSTKEQEQFDLFYKDYSPFLKEGIVMSQEQVEKEEIAKLLRFESSRCSPGERVSLPQYISRLAEGQKDVFYLAAPRTRRRTTSQLSVSSAVSLFWYSHNLETGQGEGRPHNSRHNLETGQGEGRPPDVGYSRAEELNHQRQNTLTSLLVFVRRILPFTRAICVFTRGESLLRPEVENLLPWLKKCLGGKVHTVKVTRRLDSHPCVITVEDMGAARHFLRMQSHQLTEENRYALLQPQLEINPSHPIIKKLSKLVTSNPRLAELVSQQLLANAMVSAGLVEDPRTLVISLNELLSLALEAH